MTVSSLVTLRGSEAEVEVHLPLRGLRVHEYHRMIDEGILPEDERVELIEGALIPMSPQLRRHALAIEELQDALSRYRPGAYRVRTQLPLTLEAEDSEPEPDVAVVPAGASRTSRRHPESALLVVEVASDSLAKDSVSRPVGETSQFYRTARGPKARLYARAGIPEYWIVNLVDERVEVYRDPDAAAGTYGRRLTFARGGCAVSEALDGFSIGVDTLL